MSYKVPAVVILGRLNGLGVIRSLGRGDVKSYVVDSDRLSPGMWSRYARPVMSKSLGGQDIVDSLLKLQGTLKERPVLFNTHEMAVLAISENRSKLESGFRFRLPAHETVVALQDKARFHELAISSGLPVPRGAILHADSDIAGTLRSLHFPIVVKPADKGPVHSGKALGVVVFQRFEEALAGCEEMLARAGEAIVQEWVEGGSDHIYFCLFYRGRNGKIVSMFTGRKLASSPPGIGMTAYCTAAPEARDIIEPMTESFLETVDYSGMGSVEYKWDAPNRRFVIIEPTVGRTDWQEEIATLCGVNIPFDAYCHELELPLPPRPLPTNEVVWRASLLEPLKTQRPKLAANARVCDGYWRLDDPMPAVVQYSYGTLAAIGRRLRKKINPNS
jgi:D-aspartate ligase